MKHNLMIQAHRIAKSIVKVVGDYMVAMKIALKQAWEMVSMNIVSEVALKTKQGNIVAKVDDGQVVVEAPTSGVQFVLKNVKAFSEMAYKSNGKVGLIGPTKTIEIEAEGNLSLLGAMLAATKKGCKLASFKADELEKMEEKENTGKAFNIYFDDNNKCVYGAYVY